MPRFVLVATNRRVASTAPSTAAPDARLARAVQRPRDRRGAEQEIEVMGVVEVAKAVDVPRLPRRDLDQAGDLGERPGGEFVVHDRFFTR